VRFLRLLFVLLLISKQAVAALAPAALASADVTLPSDARFPLALTSADIDGDTRSFGEILASRPGFVLFADFTCKTLCGPALVLLSSALENSGLAPDSYRVIVVGLDPKDTPKEARRMITAQVAAGLRSGIVVLHPDSATLARVAEAAGFRYVYDKSVDQFAHPELVYAVARDGRIRRLLSPFTLTTADLKNVLFASDASPSFAQQVRLICYRFGILSGPYTSTIEIALRAAAALTILVLGGAVFLMRRRGAS